MFAEGDNLREVLLGIDLPVFLGGLKFKANGTPSDAENPCGGNFLSVLEGFEQHGVGMRKIRFFRHAVIDDLRFFPGQSFQNRFSGSVALPGEGKGPIQGHLIGVGVRITAAEGTGGVEGADRMGTGRAIADFINAGNAFHLCTAAPFPESALSERKLLSLLFPFPELRRRREDDIAGGIQRGLH